MPAKWQQWMPLHIEPFRSSPYVQSMEPAARAGYIYLLMALWETDDCSISSNDRVLSILSGLNSKWEEFKDSILICFRIIDNGKLTNDRLREEWEEARRLYSAKSKGGKKEDSSKTLDRLNDTLTLTLTEQQNTISRETLPLEEYVGLWNTLRGSLPRVTQFSESRKQKLKSRINRGLTLERFKEAVICCTQKPHLKGDNGWMADFDWLIKNDVNIEKAINNPYGSKNGNTQQVAVRSQENMLNAAAKILGKIENTNAVPKQMPHLLESRN